MGVDIKRIGLWRLQQKAVRAIEKLMPDATDLENQCVCAGGPTVGASRRCAYPEYGKIWQEWVDEGEKAGVIE